MTRLTNLIKEVLSTPPSINEGLSVTEEPVHEATITFKKHSEINIYPDMSSDGHFPTPYKKGDTEKVKKIKDKGRHYEVYFMDGDFAKIDKDLIIVKESLNESHPELDKIRKEVELIAKKSPGKGWTKKHIDQEINRRFQQFLNRETVNELEERFKVIDTRTGEVIDNDLPKKLAQKLAAKKKEWYPYPDKKESTIAKIARTLDESKKKSCNCGCNTCENVGNPGVLLNESISSKHILSEDLLYHVENKLPLSDSILPRDSQEYIDLINESKYLYVREIIHLSGKDIQYLYPNKK